MDTITLAAIAAELNEKLVSGRVQAVIQPHETSLALEVYARGERHYLMLNAHPQSPCVMLASEKARRGLERDTPVLLLARKRLIGARLEDVRQLPWERVLNLTFSRGEEERTQLVAEIMGKWSNLLLTTSQGIILETLRRFGLSDNRYRTVRPGEPYVLPPHQRHKAPVDSVALADLDAWMGQSSPEEPLWRHLVQHVAGLSPLVARELVYRATGDAHATFSHPNALSVSLLDALTWYRGLPRQGGWAPTVAYTADGEPLAFAPYELTHLNADLRHYPSISQAAYAYFAATAGTDNYGTRRARVQELVDAARRKLEARRVSLGEQSVSEEDIENLRRSGEWILAYSWQVHTGDTELEADTGEGVLKIRLDPGLSASANAQAYFERYHKAKRAGSRVPELLGAVDRDLDFLEQVQTDLRLADNAPQIEELREALLATGLVTDPSGVRRLRMQRSQPLRLRSTDGFVVIVGRNALQNEEVTWRLAGPEDLWLHTERVPGAHVIVITGGNEIPQTTLLQAAAWAAYQSQARDDVKVPVLFTQRRYLRRFSGARPGQVRVLQAQSLVVVPEPIPGQ